MNEDYRHLVNVVNNFRPKCNDFEYIQDSYPGAFYRKIHDDNKIKIFKRNGSCKMYLYPYFNPRPPNTSI